VVLGFHMLFGLSPSCCDQTIRQCLVRQLHFDRGNYDFVYVCLGKFARLIRCIFYDDIEEIFVAVWDLARR